MDHELLVDEQIEDGKSLLLQLVDDGFDVEVAFWARTSEEGLWFFYIGSTSVLTMGLADAYRAVYEVLRRISDTPISISSIKIIDPNNPISRAAIEVRDRYPARQPNRYHGQRLGNLAIEEAYIYPRNGVMTRPEVLQIVTGLMSWTGALAPSLVTLRDGTQIRTIPVGIQLKDAVNDPGAIQVVFHDLVAGTNRSIAVDDVVGIN